MAIYAETVSQTKLFKQFDLLTDYEDVKEADIIKLEQLVLDVVDFAGPYLDRIRDTFKQYMVDSNAIIILGAFARLLKEQKETAKINLIAFLKNCLNSAKMATDNIIEKEGKKTYTLKFKLKNSNFSRAIKIELKAFMKLSIKDLIWIAEIITNKPLSTADFSNWYKSNEYFELLVTGNRDGLAKYVKMKKFPNFKFY